MKHIELDTREWSDEQRQQAFKKLEELGYIAYRDHSKGKMSISAFIDRTYHCFDFAPALGILTSFNELMQLTREDVK